MQGPSPPVNLKIKIKRNKIAPVLSPLRMKNKKDICGLEKFITRYRVKICGILINGAI